MSPDRNAGSPPPSDDISASQLASRSARVTDILGKNMNESFRYWQGKKIEHASSVSNLTLTLAIGSIGFGLTLLEKRPGVMIWSPCVFIASLLVLLLSAALAIMGMASRLEDFAATAQAARLRESKNHNEARLAEERATARKAGERTKAYLVWQMVTFVVGVALIASVFVVENL